MGHCGPKYQFWWLNDVSIYYCNRSKPFRKLVLLLSKWLWRLFDKVFYIRSIVYICYIQHCLFSNFGFLEKCGPYKCMDCTGMSRFFFSFPGNHIYGMEACAAQRLLLQRRWVYEGKKNLGPLLACSGQPLYYSAYLGN